jgi:hypothetical protein
MSSRHAGLNWRKRCGTGSCVEVAETEVAVLVRQSDDPSGPHLAVTREAWADFLRAVRAGEFEPLPAAEDN